MIIIKIGYQRTMISLLQCTIIVVLLAVPMKGQEWFMPDSHLINEEEFQQLVINDKTTFKIVKYFSPNCGFCRYLKQVVDKLKHQKQWCFKIYDFNCAWYPQHCMQNVKSTSFPYTAIHNGQGQLHQEIHGFYPEPVIRPIFDRIQALCLQLQNKKTSNQQTNHANSNSLTSSQSEKPKESQVKQQDQQVIPNPDVQQKKDSAVPIEQKKIQEKVDVVKKQVEQNKLDQSKIVLQQAQVKIEKSQIKHNAQEGKAEDHQNGISGDYVKYILYGLTLLISIYYFHHINKGKPLQTEGKQTKPDLLNQQSIPLMQNNNQISQQEVQVNQIIKQQSQLLDSIPDQSL